MELRLDTLKATGETESPFLGGDFQANMKLQMVVSMEAAIFILYFTFTMDLTKSIIVFKPFAKHVHPYRKFL